MSGARAENPVCSHIRFSWSPPESCAEVTQYQIAVKTHGGNFRELPAIPGSYNAYRISNMQLGMFPYDL